MSIRRAVLLSRPMLWLGGWANKLVKAQADLVWADLERRFFSDAGATSTPEKIQNR